MNVIKKSLMGLTAVALLGSATVSMAAPVDAPKTAQKRVALTEAQKAEHLQKHVQHRYADLKLSQAQLKKIEAIETQYRSNAQNVPQTKDLKQEALVNRLNQLQQERVTLLQNKAFNDAAAQQWLSQQAEVRGQLQAERQRKMAAHQLNQLKKEHAVFQVLDKKQQQAYLEQAKKPMPMQHMRGQDGKVGFKGKPHHPGHHGQKHGGKPVVQAADKK